MSFEKYLQEQLNQKKDYVKHTNRWGGEGQYTTPIELDDETLDDKDAEVLISFEYDYSLPEPQTRDYPGSDSELEITKITRTDTGKEMDEKDFNFDIIDYIQDDIWDQINGSYEDPRY